MATAQLQLITAPSEWKLDERTIEIGRAGLAQARAALAQAEPTPSLLPSDTEASAFVEPIKKRNRQQSRIASGQRTLSLFEDCNSQPGEQLLAA